MSDQQSERDGGTTQDSAVDGSWQDAQHRNDHGATGSDPTDTGADKSGPGESGSAAADSDSDSESDRSGDGRSDELTEGRPTVADEAGLDPDNDGEVDSPTPAAATSGAAPTDDGAQDEDKPLEAVDPEDRDQQGPDEATREQRAQQMPDELKIDIDEDKLKAWDDVRGSYGVKDENAAERPIMTGEGNPEPAREVQDGDDAGSDRRDDRADDRADDASSDGGSEQPRYEHEHDDCSSEEPTDGQTT